MIAVRAERAGSGRTARPRSTSSRCRARRASRFFDKPRPLPGQVFWHDFRMQFPPDAVLVKTISLDVRSRARKRAKRVETQILHFDGEDWRGYTYAWRDDQTDADLVPADGGREDVHASGRRGSRAGGRSANRCGRSTAATQCMTLPQRVGGVRAGVQPRQLNRPAASAARTHRTSSCGSTRGGLHPPRRRRRTSRCRRSTRSCGEEGARSLATRSTARHRSTSGPASYLHVELRPLPPVRRRRRAGGARTRHSRSR